MKKYFVVLGILAAFAMTASVVKADPGPYDAPLIADIYDTNGADAIATPSETVGEINIITTISYLLANAGVGNPFTDNTSLDPIQLTFPHSYWANSGGIGMLAYVSTSAGGVNTPYLYAEGAPGAPVGLAPGVSGDIFFGDGTFASPYPGLFNPFGVSNFGVLVDHAGISDLYSDPALNGDGYDHMLAFDLNTYLSGTSIWIDTDQDGDADSLVTLSNVYVLAFEDKPLGSAASSDHDFNDSIFLFANVTPVPEPVTMALFGTGLLGMAGLRRKKA